LMSRSGWSNSSGGTEPLRAKLLRPLDLRSTASRGDIAATLARENQIWGARMNSPEAARRQEADQMMRCLGLPEEALSKQREPSDDVSPNSREVCSHSIGVVVNGKSQVIVPRNTPVPCQGKHIIVTETDDQTEIVLQVTAGEDEELEYVTIICEAPVKIPPYPKGASVEVTFRYDCNGVIGITAFDLTAKEPLGEVQLVRKGDLTNQQLKAKKVELRKAEVN